MNRGNRKDGTLRDKVKMKTVVDGAMEESSNTGTKTRLLKEHNPTEFGRWRILGEDPNCDLGGHHHQPELDTVEGTYSNVVEYALSLPNFFSWGYGGEIRKEKSGIKNIDSIVNNPRIKQLEKEKKEIQARLIVIEEELENLKK